ncbi:sigma-70 family RNA polymerase sigma factor [Litoribacter alkaliphilus]|uniref:Sigma-70 family RNA polymerase sigma factor n=1 Tax=Litoribacter ruber TaxID=702568 RepID=A0AAP2CH19_9BACT|nr:sigma-70 family RNA polymerase sigma factor [Litoribacter alkaliphilus]MBS9524551.1 sigma-70 family RNA polymerase sigma factor [Litoribacter alkaliphilus]
MIQSTLDKGMWEELRKGKQRALKDIYEKYFEDLYHYGCCMCHDSSLVEDGIQDVFIDLFHYRSKISSPSNPKAYLISCLRRKLLSNLKKSRLFSLKPDATDFLIEESLEKNLISQETDQRILLKLKMALKKLTPRQKEIIFLKFVKDMDYEAISEILDMSPASCRTLMYRTAKCLKEELNDLQILQNPSLQKSTFTQVLRTFLPVLF